MLLAWIRLVVRSAAPQLAAQLFSNQAGLGARHIPYKGSAPAISDVIAGHVHFVLDAAGVLQPHVRAGKLQAIATPSARRLAALPDVPTVAETISGFEATNYYGAVVPAGTPASTIRTLQTAIANAMQEPDVREKMLALNAVPVGSTPEEFGRHMKAESTRWGAVIRDANIRPE